jgi:outer membrane protein OmpA-like peptidoglycan-associated protein
MKIVASVLTALLVVMLGVGAVFYLKTYKPLADDYARMKSALPAYEKDRAELKKLQGKASKETAWLNPAVEALSTGLASELKSSKAEVLVSGNKVIVNISEQELFLPDSYTFAQGSPQLRSSLIDLLKSPLLKGKDISIGNSTHAVPAQGRGRKKVPAKDARKLAAERSAALIKDFEKNGINQDVLIAAAYSPKQPAAGFTIRERKTVIIIEDPPTAAPLGATKPEGARQAPAKPVPDTRSTVTVPAPRPALLTQPRPIPILPAQPKAQ